METQGKNKTGFAKNIIILFFASSTLVAGYLALDQYTEKQQIQRQIDTEEAEIEQYLFDSFAKIEQNLVEITAHEGQLQMDLSGEYVEGIVSPEERINREIGHIESLMNENQHLIASLQTKVGNQDKQLIKYNYRINGLNKKIEQYKIQADELKQLNDSLSEDLIEVKHENIVLTFNNEEKEHQIGEQTEVINKQTEDIIKKEELIHTVFYTVSSYRDLEDAEVVQKEGGLLGFGTTRILKDDFDRSKFIKIDKRRNTLIPVFSKKAKLVTKHNSSSYEWVVEDQQIKWIKISDPELFWESTKYMVIATRE